VYEWWGDHLAVAQGGLRWPRRGGGEGYGIGDLVLKRSGERCDGEPGRREDVGAALTVQEEGEPEREGYTLRWSEGRRWTL
jgi:hypothetical protein